MISGIDGDNTYDKEISKLVNTYKEVTKSDDDYEIKKYSNKFKRKYDITDIEEMLCPGKCPEKNFHIVILILIRSLDTEKV